MQFALVARNAPRARPRKPLSPFAHSLHSFLGPTTKESGTCPLPRMRKYVCAALYAAVDLYHIQGSFASLHRNFPIQGPKPTPKGANPTPNGPNPTRNGQIQPPMDQNERTGDKANRPKPNHPQRVAQKKRLKTNITINEPEGHRDKEPAKQRVQERRSRESRKGQGQQAKKPGSPSPNKAPITATHKIRHFVRLSFGKVSFSSLFARFGRENTSLCTDFRQMLKTCHFVRLTDEKMSI